MTTFFDTAPSIALHVDIRDATDCARRARTRHVCQRPVADRGAGRDRQAHRQPFERADLEDAIRLQWDRYAVVPVDQRCLDRAAALLREQPIRLADAIQLAAAERLPGPVRYVTFDPIQIPVALGLGFDVVSS